jgi:hypothetical protein
VVNVGRVYGIVSGEGTPDGSDGPQRRRGAPGRHGSNAARGPTLLGAVALEGLVLAVDPVAKRPIPVEGFVGELQDAA